MSAATNPATRQVRESAFTGRGHRRHRHIEFAADDGARIIVSRYANRTARVTVFAPDGSRREFRESNAGDDRWLIAVVGYRLKAAEPVS